MRMLSTAAAARIAGCSSDTIRRACQNEDLESEMVEGKRGLVWRVQEDSLRKWMETREREKIERLEEAKGPATPQEDRTGETAGQQDESRTAAAELQDGTIAKSAFAALRDSLKEALEVAREQRADRLEAERRAAEAEQNAFRLARRVQALMCDLESQNRLLSENAESIVEKEAALKQQEALKAEKAEKAERERVLQAQAEEEAHKARAEAREASEKLRIAEMETEKARAEAAKTAAMLKEARTELESWGTRRKQSFWNRLFSKSS